MNFLERISANVNRIIGTFSESALLCVFLTGTIAMVSMISIRCIVSGLFEMHRSKSAVKKVRRNYSFTQKLLLVHAWQDCLHAKRFCRRLIVFHHMVAGLFLAALILAICSHIWSALMPFLAYLTLFFLIGVTVPVCILNFILDRHPFQKMKHEYTFRKYHNTQDHENLW